MNQTSAHFFVNYCEKVLGLRALPRRELRRPPLLILDIPWPEGLQHDEMFQKMMQALELPANSFEVVEFLPGEYSQHKTQFEQRVEVLSFSSAISEVIDMSELKPAFRLTTACGPRDLRQSPDKKRETWEVLKTIKARLRS